MKRRLFKIRDYSTKKKIYILFIFIITILTGIGYAVLTSNLAMRGKIAVRAITDVRIKNYEYKECANGGENISASFGKDSVTTNFSLPNLNSTVTYDVTTINKGNVVMLIKSITEEINNPNITFDISNLTLNSTLLPGDRQTYTFQITFKYKSNVKTLPAVTEFNSKLRLVFDKKVSTIVRDGNTNAKVFRKSMARNTIESIEFLNTNEVPNDALDSWDASASSDGSVMAYTLDEDEDSLYELYIGGVNGVVSPVDSSYEFVNFSKAVEIDFNNNYDTSNVTNMAGMFYSCISLTSLDVTNFNTSNVTTMSSMFTNCRGLTSLDLSSFNTSNVTNMDKMFASSATTAYNDNTYMNLASITFGDNFDTTNVTNMSYMFVGCRELTSLDLSHFDTTKVTTMASMFWRCRGLTTLNLSGWDNSVTTNMSGMFLLCSELTTLNLTNFKTPAATNMSNMFVGCLKLTTLDLSSFNTSNVTNMAKMFCATTNNYLDNTGMTLQSINFGNNFNTTNVTNMSWMFYGCKKLASLDVTKFNTSNVTNMDSMFHSCSSLTSLDVTNFNTSNVTTMSTMFALCTGLSSLDLSSFNTTNVTGMSGMFSNSIYGSNGTMKLASITFGSNFNTTNVTDMSKMFRGCPLTSLDLSTFDTSNVTNMNEMFNGCGKLTDLNISKLTFKDGVTTTSMFAFTPNVMNITVKSATEQSTILGMKPNAVITIAPSD